MAGTAKGATPFGAAGHDGAFAASSKPPAKVNNDGTPGGAVYGPLGTGKHFEELQRRLNAFWSQSPLAAVARGKGFRRYADLSKNDRAGCRSMYEAGETIMRIASVFGVYPGGVQTAAEDEGWTRKRPTQSIAARIVAAVAAVRKRKPKGPLQGPPPQFRYTGGLGEGDK